jgi:predicted O-methyltransferase YrrM
VVAFLKERLHPGLALFEYGCGYSTVWFAKRVKVVVAVETDTVWLAAIAPLLRRSNVTLLQHDAGDLDHYAALVREQRELFDVVIIDGLARVACAQHSVKALTEEGVLV